MFEHTHGERDHVGSFADSGEHVHTAERDRVGSFADVDRGPGRQLPMQQPGQLRFLVHSRMTRPLDAKIGALFPAEQARAAELFAAGSLEQLYVAADYSQAWLIARGASVAEARAAIESLPLAPFVQSAYTPLAELA